MNTPQVQVSGSVYSRILWIFGFYTLLYNAVFLISYYWLPVGFLRGSPVTTSGQVVGEAQTFWGQLALTLLFNLGLVSGFGIIMNFIQVKGISLGYLYPLFAAIFTGLITGTNSFVSSDMTQYNVRDGMALALSIGNIEMLGYFFIVASSVRFGIYQYTRFWQWAPIKVMKLGDVRLAKPEIICLVNGILLVIFGAYRETLMSFNML